MEQPTRDQLTIRIDPARDHVLGDASAAVTLVEFADFECSHCARAVGLVDEVRARLGARLRFAYRHFPIPELHPHAQLAAEASEAAAAQGRFWEMHALLFGHQDALDRASLVGYAERLGLDVDRFAGDLDGGAFRQVVDLQAEGGQWLGVNGTPAFFIDGRPYAGAHEPDALEAALLAAADAAEAKRG
jgi:NhaA family Na+:H+ antiporter